MEVMEVPFEWTLTVTIRRGEAFSASGHNPLIVERDSHGNQTILARIHPVFISCRDSDLSHSVYCTIRDGTRPEDLRVELQCPHRTVLAIPDAFSVSVLRYAPEAYSGVPGVETTESFSWAPKERDFDVHTARMRVLTVEAARACGYSEEDIYPKNGKWGSPCRTLYGICTSIDFDFELYMLEDPHEGGVCS